MLTNFHWRRFLLEQGRWRRDRDAEGVEGKGNGEEVSPFPADWIWGASYKLPHRGPGRSPGRKRVFVHSELERTHVVATNLVFLAGGGPTLRGYIAYVIPPHFFKGGAPPGSTPMPISIILSLLHSAMNCRES